MLRTGLLSEAKQVDDLVKRKIKKEPSGKQRAFRRPFRAHSVVERPPEVGRCRSRSPGDAPTVFCCWDPNHGPAGTAAPGDENLALEGSLIDFERGCRIEKVPSFSIQTEIGVIYLYFLIIAK